MCSELTTVARRLLRSPMFSMVAVVTLAVGVSAADPGTFVLASVLMVGVALLATYLPARREDGPAGGAAVRVIRGPISRGMPPT